MKRFIIIGLLIICTCCSINLEAQNKTVTFIADTTTIFPNPERGWIEGTTYMPPGGGIPGNNTQPHAPVTVAKLHEIQTRFPGTTLVRDCILIGAFMNPDVPLSQARLDEIQADFNSIRSAGFKSVPRVFYHWGMVQPAPGPEEEMQNVHVDQIAALFKKNADVIAFVEAGLFGGTGEPHNDQQGYVLSTSSRHGGSCLSEKGVRVYLRYLHALPADRMMAIRFGRMKWDLFGWGNATEAKPVLLSEAYNGSDKSRIGQHNDGFLGDLARHWGSFVAAGEKQFTYDDDLYTCMGGEPSGTSADNTNPTYVISEFSKLHQTGFNVNGTDAPRTYTAWKNTGIYDQIARKLGYCFRLVSASIPQTLSKGSTFTMSMNMANDGWARIINPRKVEIIFRNKTAGTKYVIDIDGDGRGNRLWLPGPGETKTLNISRPLPTGMPAGQYDLFLNLPDPYPSLHDRPEYSIRLANKNIWEARTGYNSLISNTMITN